MSFICAMFRAVIRCIYIYIYIYIYTYTLFFNPAIALGCMNVIVVNSNQGNVSFIQCGENKNIITIMFRNQSTEKVI